MVVDDGMEDQIRLQCGDQVADQYRDDLRKIVELAMPPLPVPAIDWAEHSRREKRRAVIQVAAGCLVAIVIAVGYVTWSLSKSANVECSTVEMTEVGEANYKICKNLNTGDVYTTR